MRISGQLTNNFKLHELLSVFFLSNTLFQYSLWVKIFFFSSHKDKSWDEFKKVAYLSSLPYFFLSSMHKLFCQITF
jgi:hypothetical protein